MKIKIEKIDLFQRTNMKIGKIVSSVKYRMDKNSETANFLSQIVVF